MKNYDFILFDLDGTVTDPGIGITNSVMYALRRFGIEVSERETLYKFIGPPLIDSFMEFYGFDREKAILAVEYYREYYTETGILENRVYEGIPELFESLVKAGKKIILATSKPELFAKQILEHFGLSVYFYFTAGAALDETRTNKAEVIAYALESCQIKDKSGAVMIGDREHDIIGAKKNGLESVGVLFGYGSRLELENAGADYIAEDVAALKNLLIK